MRQIEKVPTEGTKRRLDHAMPRSQDDQLVLEFRLPQLSEVDGHRAERAAAAPSWNGEQERHREVRPRPRPR